MNQYTLYIRLYNYIGSLIDKYFNDHSNATGRWDIEHMFRPPTVLTRLNNEKSSFPFTEELLSLLNYVLFQQLGSLLYSSLAHISTIRNVGKVCIFSQNNREFGVIKLRQTYVGTLNGQYYENPNFGQLVEVHLTNTKIYLIFISIWGLYRLEN